MSNAKLLGRLERVELRTVWASEANDFTPWLATPENIAILGDAIGVDLEVESTETQVGPFRADILCKDTAEDDRFVLIENQLERTDHSHLGQLLTYAAGLRTVTIVWIAERFTEEHRAALDWLNEITNDSFNFFGLEIELWRIGNSPIAPKFNVVCKPNGWTKSSGTTQSGELTDAKKLQLDYWRTFHERLQATNSKIKGESPSPRHWNGWALGRSNFWLSTICAVRDENIAVKLLIAGTDARTYYEILETRKAEIEAALGTTVEWYAPEGVKRCALILRRKANPADRSTWAELQEWQRENLERFYSVFRPMVMGLELPAGSTAMETATAMTE